MAGEGPLRVAVVGCGNISKGYAQTLAPHSDKVRIVGAYDMMRERAEAFVKEFGGRAYESMESLLGDADVEAVINLTIQQAHPTVTSACLNAGKHVHSEKPLALTYAEAKELVALGRRKKLRLSTAPATQLGEAQQTAWKILRSGRLGTLRIVYADMNHGRIESWHPQPEPFYIVGPLFDVGVYPLTVITQMLGPVASVQGYARCLWPQRTTLSGQNFNIQAPDWVCGFLNLESGPLVRLVTSFYVGPTKQNGIELHGDTATLYLSDAVRPDAQVQTREFGKWEWTDEPLLREPFKGWDWGRGVIELAEAVREDRPQRCTGEQAAHVVEIINGILKSASTNRPVKIRSRFTPPPPLPWGE